MFKVIKRGEMSSAGRVGVQIAGVALALVAAAVFLLFVGLNPLEVYAEMLKGSYATPYRIRWLFA